MTTVAYTLEPVGTLTSNTLAVDRLYGDAVTTNGGDIFLADQSASFSIFGRLFDPNLVPRGGELPVSTTAGVNSNAHSTVLTGGSIVTTYDNTNAGVVTSFIKITDEHGVVIKNGFELPASIRAQSDAEVTALHDGGFVVSWTRDYTGNDLDTEAQIYEADGTLRGSVIPVDSDSALATFDSSVAGLANGNFVVAFSQEPVAGGDDAVFLRIYDAAGNPTGPGNAKFDVDSFGSVNDQVTIAALKDGGFAVAYRDNGWNSVTSGNDITFKIFNADGSDRTDYIRANATTSDETDGGDTAGAQSNPTLTQLKNGDIVVGWQSETGSNDINARVYAPNGLAVTAITKVAATGNTEFNPSFTNLGEGGAFVSWTKFQGGHYNQTGGELDLVRTSTGTASGETIKGDSLVDRILGLKGDDKLYGKGGNDLLTGGKGDDKLVGGLGADTLKGGKGVDILDAGKDNAQDVFVFTGKHETGKADDDDDTWDQIRNFDKHSSGEKISDKIDLSAIDADSKSGDQAFRFVDHFSTAKGKKPDGQVTVHHDGKDVDVRIDFNGDNHTDAVIQVHHVSSLHEADFIL